MKIHLLLGTAMVAALAAGAGPAMATDTLSAGAGVPFSNYQPSLALTENFALQGIYPSNSSGGLEDGADHYNLSMVRNFAGAFNPGNAFANGETFELVDPHNAATYSIIGSAYGGDGVSYFNAPDLRGATIVGATSPAGQMATSGYQVGQQLGSATTTLDVSQLPAHDHTLPGGGVTSTVGGNAPFDQHEPSLTMTYLIAANGIYPGSGSAVSIGQVAAFAGGYIPLGWRPADGELLNISDYAALYSIVGTTYGGDGVTTFALPDLRGRTIVGAGAGPGLTPVALGESFGDASTVLTLSQLAPHDHDLPGGGSTGSTGGGAPVSNEQPSLGLNYLISLGGVFPTRDAFDQEFPYYGEVIAFAGNYAPNGYAFADGQLLSIQQNEALFSILGTTYGGDGIQTFALPDLRGRDIVGTSEDLLVGTQLGTESTVLTEANLPAHTHMFSAVPEPSSWAVMLVGFGLVGAMTRRRRLATA